MSMSKKTNQVRDGEIPRVSFEFFPARNEAAEESLWSVVKRLEPLRPDFVSVTYGAGGSTRDRSITLLRRLVEETTLECAAHLTAVSASRAEADAVAREFANLGIRRFVALRGDGPGGVGATYHPDPDGYANAAELTAGLRRMGDFDISVAAYPEKHPESADLAADIDMLKRKVDAGACRALTQYFFDNDAFERYVERVRKAGISIPIVPGIMPVHNFRQLSSFSARCGATIPAWLAARCEGLDADPRIHELVAAATAAEQVHDLIRRGVREFHFYTMNRAELVLAVCQTIGIRAKPAVENRNSVAA
jgi:methylenetetrahydrofolate reductase (NADPH)